MNKVIVFYHSNCGFALEVDGFRIFNSRQEFEDTLTKYLEEHHTLKICVGTGLIIEYDNEENFLHSFSFRFLSDEEYETIEKIFGTKYGLFPNLED